MVLARGHPALTASVTTQDHACHTAGHLAQDGTGALRGAFASTYTYSGLGDVGLLAKVAGKAASRKARPGSLPDAHRFNVRLIVDMSAGVITDRWFSCYAGG